MYGPCELCVVSILSSGISGIKTEKFPSSEVKCAQPLLSTTLLGGGVLLGVAGRGVLVGLGLCSCALREMLSASVIISKGKNFFMSVSLSGRSTSEPADYNPRIHADDTES